MIIFQIRDGGNENAPLLGTFCGSNLPPAMASTGDQVWLQFMSDFSVANNGFRLEYITNGMFYCSEECKINPEEITVLYKYISLFCFQNLSESCFFFCMVLNLYHAE